MKMGGRDIAVALAAVAVFVVVGLAEAQTSTDCASKLVPCGEFITSKTNPSPTCCDAIKLAVETQLDCLCNLYSSGTLKSIGINITEALHLTKACGLPDDLSNCNKTSSVPSPNRGSTPAAPGNDGKKLVSTGLFASLLLLLASLILD